MKFGIVTFPGSNCDYDAFHAVVDGFGEDATYLWHKGHDLEGADVIILPGGFSYGDYLRAGAIARFSPIMQEVQAHATRGRPVLAVCNGFQIACEAGLLPGALLRNASLRFECDGCASESRTPRRSLRAIRPRAILRIPIAPERVVYCQRGGTRPTRGRRTGRFQVRNTAGQVDQRPIPMARSSIAGIVSGGGNVLNDAASERAVEPLLVDCGARVRIPACACGRLIREDSCGAFFISASSSFHLHSRSPSPAILMTRAQVVERLGKPATERSSGGFTYMFYITGVTHLRDERSHHAERRHGDRCDLSRSVAPFRAQHVAQPGYSARPTRTPLKLSPGAAHRSTASLCASRCRPVTEPARPSTRFARTPRENAGTRPDTTDFPEVHRLRRPVRRSHHRIRHRHLNEPCNPWSGSGDRRQPSRNEAKYSSSAMRTAECEARTAGCRRARAARVAAHRSVPRTAPSPGPSSRR